MLLKLLVFGASFVASICLELDIPPTISVQAEREYFYRADTDVLLPCEADGQPDPTYTWLKNGAPMNLTAIPNVTLTTKGNLQMSPATNLDQGYYQCFAENKHGVAMSDISVLTRAEFGNRPLYPPVQSIVVNEGDPLTIPCDPPASVPPPTFMWTKIRDIKSYYIIDIDYDERVNIDPFGNLHFAYVKASDGGMHYRCYILNSFLRMMVHDAYFLLTVNPAESTHPRPPALSYHPSKFQYVLEGDTLTMKCLFTGMEAPAVTWTRAIEDIDADQERHGPVLEIRNVQLSDDGWYTCTGVNSEGSAAYSTTVSVRSRPKFSSQSADVRLVSVTVEAGGSVEFNCKAEAVPPALVKWMINGQPVDVDTMPERMAITDDGKTMRIDDVCRNCSGHRFSDMMVVQCNASNAYGHILGEGYLKVTEADGDPSIANVCLHDLEDCQQENRQLKAQIRQMTYDLESQVENNA